MMPAFSFYAFFRALQTQTDFQIAFSQGLSISIKQLIKPLLYFMMSFIFLVTLPLASYAEPAPVYDADAMQQTDEGNSSQEENQELANVSPEKEGAYLLNQQPVGAPPLPSRPLSLDQRLKKVEQQIENMQSSETINRIDSLQGQIQSIRGELEQIGHQLDQLQNQQKMLYSDLDKRVNQQLNNIKRIATNSEGSQSTQSETKKVSTSAKVNDKPLISASKPIEPRQPNVAEEQKIYQTAYNYIKNKQYNEAVSTLQGMLNKYPTGQFASNAHYWLGELYVLMSKNDEAITEFNGVVSNFPDSPRVSDALFKVGHIYASESKWIEAKLTFKKVISHYPGTASARLASEQLKQIKQTGH